MRPCGLFVPLIVGILPAVLLLAGRLIKAPPGYPAELPLALSLLAMVVVYVTLAWSLSSALLRQEIYNSAISSQDAAAKVMRLLAVLYTAVAAAMMFIAIIPFGPIWYVSAAVGITMVVVSGTIVCIGIFLLANALKRRHRFALLMAGLFMSTYVATVIIFWHVIRRL